MMYIITPCGSSMSSKTYYDLLRVQSTMMSDVMMGPVMGSMHQDQLILAVKEARRSGATHLGIVEHDMRFPPDAFHRLLAHNKPVIGANYRQRQQDKWTAVKNRTTYVSSRNRTGIEPVLSVGMGVQLIDMAVFAKLNVPWWSAPFDTEEGRHMGVDVYFGHNVDAVGLTSWVDHDLSQDVGHIAGDIELWCDKMVYTQTGEMVAAAWH